MAHTDLSSVSFEEEAHKTLIDCHGALQKKRRVGYFASQALRQLMEHIDDSNIVQLAGHRTASDSTIKGVPISKGSADYLFRDTSYSESVRLEYDRKENRPFKWNIVEEDLRSSESVYDLAVTHAVVKVDDTDISDFISTFIEQAMDRLDRDISTSWVRNPIYVTLKPNPTTAQSTGSGQSRREHIQEYTPAHYFQSRGDADGTDPGLNWTTIQSLDLAKVESRHGFLNSGDIVFQEKVGMGDMVKFTPSDIEDELINTYSMKKPRFGAINSEVLIERVKQALFDHDSFGMSIYDWDTSQGWSETG